MKNFILNHRKIIIFLACVVLLISFYFPFKITDRLKIEGNVFVTWVYNGMKDGDLYNTSNWKRVQKKYKNL